MCSLWAFVIHCGIVRFTVGSLWVFLGDMFHCYYSVNMNCDSFVRYMFYRILQFLNHTMFY